jgi:hypothetical protein
MSLNSKTTEMLMKNVLKQTAGRELLAQKVVRGSPRWLALAAIAACVVRLQAGTPAISNDWRFDTGANPSTPEVSVGGTGTSQVTIAPGPFASGWIASADVLGGNTGIWDLGRDGTITLSNPAGLAGDSSQMRDITLKVSQWNDGGIYNTLNTVSVPGASAVSSKVYAASVGDLGQWEVQETHWLAGPGSAINTITITGAYNGSLIDDVVLEVSLLPPAQLTIQPLGSSQVQISWSDAYSSMILESNPNVADPQGWKTVQTSPQHNGNIMSVTVDTASAQFFRLKQP